MNVSGVNAIAPGVISTCSTPASSRNGQIRSAVETAAVSQPSDTLPDGRFEAKASAR